MSALIALTLAVIPSLVGATGDMVGCYSSVPSSWVDKGSYTWQSSDYCSSQCSGYDFYAMSGNKCYCGSSQPSGSQSNSCSTTCDGYPSDMCGGTNAYNVYAQEGVTVSSANSDDSGSSSTEDSTSAAGTSSTAAASSSQTNAGATTSAAGTSSDSESSSETSSTNSDSANPTTSSKSSATVETTVLNSSTIVTSVVTVTSKTSSPKSTDTSSSSSATSSATASSTPESKKSSSGSNTGAIAGGVVGGVVGLGLIAAGLFFFIWRKRRNDDYESGDNTSNGIVDDVAYEEALKSSTNPFASEQDDTANRVMLGRRRLSDGSLADAADYNRKVLRVANPDDDIPENNTTGKF
ncbi:hypothetical protein BRETT_001776 [Brettanomyces bruxellensis]|uniref:WSC domain-containing protein n=1 Tax=Dekkera bruxellensis TaxID=5007 RepID=A0A871R4R7_DEKBR|nr:uncharacterized protein BRETT_001776 [Brettanomyces bruxellensis]QOU18708.1 hypothetical protein BRETT_001776 [Brettanomyces bruxellensis]